MKDTRARGRGERSSALFRDQDGRSGAARGRGASGEDRRPVGEEFRAARERRRLPLETVARALRISSRNLRALEESAYERLPATVYVRGFVRAYAEFLGLDPVGAVRRVTQEIARQPRRTTGERRFLQPLRAFRHPRRVVHPRVAAVTGGVVAAVAVLTYFFVEVRSFTRAPFLSVSEPPGNVEISGSTVVVRGRTDPTAEVRINGERTFVRSDGTFEETVGVGGGVNTLRISGTSVGGREQVVTREVLVRAPPPPAEVASPAEEAKPEGPFRLTVRAEGETVWVSLIADGRPAFSGLLLPGSTQSVEGREVRVTSGKGRRTAVRVDGEERGALSDDPGVVRDAVFTRAVPSGTVERR